MPVYYTKRELAKALKSRVKTSFLMQDFGGTVDHRDVKVKGNWLFFKPYLKIPTSDVYVFLASECYFDVDVPDNSVSPFAIVSLSESPFVRRNKASVNDLVSRLDSTYSSFLQLEKEIKGATASITDLRKVEAV